MSHSRASSSPISNVTNMACGAPLWSWAQAGDASSRSLHGPSTRGCWISCTWAPPRSVLPAAWDGGNGAGSSAVGRGHGKLRCIRQGRLARILYWYGAGTLRELSYIGLPASVMFHTISGMACFQACDWPSSVLNRSTGVSRRRVVRVVASLWQVLTPSAQGGWSPRRLDPEAEDGGAHDDGGVSMAMKLIKSRWFRCIPDVRRWSTDNPWSLSQYICAYVGVSYPRRSLIMASL